MKIEISREHTLPYKTARKKAEAIACQMHEHYKIEWRWEASTIHFRGAGVSSSDVHGFLVVAERQLRLVLHLPWLLWGAKDAIKTAIESHLDGLKT